LFSLEGNKSKFSFLPLSSIQFFLSTPLFFHSPCQIDPEIKWCMILKELQFVVWTISFFHGPHPDQDEKLSSKRYAKFGQAATDNVEIY